MTPNGVALGVQDPTGAHWNFNYDAQGNLTQVVDPNAHSYSFGYDFSAGAPDYHDLAKITDPDNQSTQITYSPAGGDSGGYVSSITDGTGFDTMTYSGFSTYAIDNDESFNVNETTSENQNITYSYTSNMLHYETIASTNNDAHYAATTLY